MPWVYFPPRLVKTLDSLHPQEQLDEAVERYISKSICILGEEESMKNVLKIIDFANQFKDLR